MAITVNMDFDDGQLGRALEVAREKLNDRFEELGLRTGERAKELSPVGNTATNKRSITVDLYEGGQRRALIQGRENPDASDGDAMPDVAPADGFAVWTQSGYGGYLEVGTSKMEARPYIRTGFMQSVDEMVAELEGMF